MVYYFWEGYRGTLTQLCTSSWNRATQTEAKFHCPSQGSDAAGVQGPGKEAFTDVVTGVRICLLPALQAHLAMTTPYNRQLSISRIKVIFLP